MKNNRSAIKLILILTIVTCAATLSKAKEKPKQPIFFSYAWPIGPETTRDFTQIDMENITVIDIGPDSLSYPPSIRKHYPKDVFDRWHKQGILLVRRCYDRPFGPDNKKIPLPDVTVEQLIERWSTALEEPYVDGISIDEFIKKDPGIVSVWVEALETIRKKYPDALIFCWIAGKGLSPGALHVALRDNADYIMPEIYYKESQAKDFPDFDFPRFRAAVDTLEKNAPGISKKIIMGMVTNDNPRFNDVQEIELTEFMEAQFKVLTTDPILKKLTGLAFYAPMKLSQKNIKHLDYLIGKYYLSQ